MIVEKLMMPYVLASHHVTIHFAMLLSLITQIIIDTNQQKQEKADWLFPNENEEVSQCYCLFLIIHPVVIFIELVSKWLKFSSEINIKNGKVFSGKFLYFIKYLDLIKVTLVFSASCYAQTVVTKNLENN